MVCSFSISVENKKVTIESKEFNTNKKHSREIDTGIKTLRCVIVCACVSFKCSFQKNVFAAVYAKSAWALGKIEILQFC